MAFFPLKQVALAPYAGAMSFLSVSRCLRFLLPIAAVFLAHYVTANLYAAICAPLSLRGLLLSFFTTSSPVCNALLGVLTYTSNNYALVLGAALMAGVTAFTTAVGELQPASAAAVPSCGAGTESVATRRQRREAGAGPTPA